LKDLVEAIFEQLPPHPGCFRFKVAQIIENETLGLLALYKRAQAYENKRERTDLQIFCDVKGCGDLIFKELNGAWPAGF
jgi:hypothetical protein